INALIVMPDDAANLKVANTKAWGANVVLHGRLSSEREARMNELAAQTGQVVVHPYADDLIKAGQGTAALEILSDEAEIEAIVAPVGGGGLISGLATAAKGQKPSLTMIGVEPAGANRYSKSRVAGQPLTIETEYTIADGTRGNYASLANFPLIEARVDELVSANDEILQTAIYAYARLVKLVVEPSGALPLAALLAGKLKLLKGKKVCLVISGGNLNLTHYTHWLAAGEKTFELLNQ
ncbi:MAG: pyridoxal-phosphate dependent enzyme, partial [Clostridiales bacterium]|nr:pyridoxal-phosphate dependent enzyme [Clostridiales bacterium]